MKSIYSISFLAALSSCSSLGQAAMSCKDVSIPVNAKAKNTVLPNKIQSKDLTLSFLNSVLAGLPTMLTGGKYTIHGRYCEPATRSAHRQDTLQVLVHGITYTVNYWSGLAPPGTKAGQDKYSWIEYASNEGYPTLSIDRLCNGQSSRPNGLEACQSPLEAEVMHKVIQAARSGNIPGMKKKFSKIIYVGHSYGSLVANLLAIMHPRDVDSYVLAGYSRKLNQGAYGVVVRPTYLPAKTVQPKKWHDLNDPSYIIATSQQGALDVFYYGKYKKQEAQYDWDHRETVTYGEFATALLGQQKAPDYKGSVFVLNGNEDNIFCASYVSSTTGNAGNCTNGFSEGVKSGYPSASAFDFFNTPNTGHCLNTHATAQRSFKAAHDFMSKQGF